MASPSPENPIDPKELGAEKPRSVEIGKLQEMTKEQLIKLVLDMQKQVSGLSEQAVKGSETRMESSVSSAGGGPEDVKSGDVALSGVNEEIKNLGQRAGAEMSTVLAESSPTVEEPSATVVNPEVVSAEVLKDDAEVVENKPQIPETLIWTPADLRKVLPPEDITAFNEVLSSQKDWRDKPWTIDTDKLQKDFKAKTGKSLNDSLVEFTDTYKALHKYGYKTNVVDLWQNKIGDEIYSSQQASGVHELGSMMSSSKHPEIKARAKQLFYKFLTQNLDILKAERRQAQDIKNNLSVYDLIKKMPDLPFPPVKEGEEKPVAPVSEKPAETTANKIEEKPPEPTVRIVEVQKPVTTSAEILQPQTSVKETVQPVEKPVAPMATPKYEAPTQTPEQKALEDLNIMTYVPEGEVKYQFTFPPEMSQQNPYATRFFAKFLPRESPRTMEDKRKLVQYGHLGMKKYRSYDDMGRIKEGFAKAGLQASFDAIKQYVDNYWDQMDREVKVEDEGGTKQSMEKNLETDPEFEKLPANVKELMRIFNNEIYGNKLRGQDYRNRINQLMQEKGLKAFETKSDAKVLSDAALLNGPYTLEELRDSTNSNFFGVTGPDGGLYLVPSSILPSRLVYERFNEHQTMGKDGKYEDPHAQTENKAPVRVLKPFIMRKNGDKYSLEKKGMFVAAA